MINILATLLSWGLGALFVVAGGSKALDPGGFQATVAAYQLLPTPATAAVALYLPYLEIVLGLALFLPTWRPAAGYLLGTLLLAFSLPLAWAWSQGLDIDCGCFGELFWTLSPAWALLRNLGLLLALVFILWGTRPHFKLRESAS